MLEKAGAYFAEVRLVFVVVLLQVSEELPLELVDLFDVAENGLQLEVCEHVRALVALTDVALKVGRKKTKPQRHFRFDQQEVLQSSQYKTKQTK